MSQYNEYIANGSTRLFLFRFAVFDRSDLQVSIDGVPQTSGWLPFGLGSGNGGAIEFATAPATGAVIRITRIEIPPQVPFLLRDENLADIQDKPQARINLGVAVGTDVQAHDADLDWLSANLTVASKALLDDVDAAAQRATLGAAAASHAHAASDITSGTIGTALLGSGSANSSTYLRGDQTWASVDTGIALGTAQTTTSGTSIDFTSIPAGTKRIMINLAGVSTSGTSGILFQLGDSGGVESSGYAGSGGYLNGPTMSMFTNGFGLNNSTAADRLSGSVTLVLVNASSNTWCASGMIGGENNNVLFGTAGAKSLSATLDRVRITTGNGSDTFDAGTINITTE